MDAPAGAVLMSGGAPEHELHMTRWLASAAIGAAVAFLAPPASAASFNCAFAGLPAEVAICNDPTLGSLDEEMARQYFTLIRRAAPDVAAAIRGEQRDWLARRNACGYDGQCIMGSYRARLQRLGEWRDEFDNAEQQGDEDQQQYDGGDEEQQDGSMGDGPYDNEGYDSFGPESDPGDEVVPFEHPYGDAD
jgi:uncharacterized protein